MRCVLWTHKTLYNSFVQPFSVPLISAPLLHALCACVKLGGESSYLHPSFHVHLIQSRHMALHASQFVWTILSGQSSWHRAHVVFDSVSYGKKKRKIQNRLIRSFDSSTRNRKYRLNENQLFTTPSSIILRVQKSRDRLFTLWFTGNVLIVQNMKNTNILIEPNALNWWRLNNVTLIG